MKKKPEKKKRRKLPSKKELEDRWYNAIIKTTSNYGELFLMRENDDFGEYDSIGMRLSLKDLRIIINKVKSKELPVLFINIKDLAICFAGENNIENIRNHILAYLHLYAKALDENKKHFLGKRINSWRKELTSNSIRSWYKERTRNLLENKEFVKQKKVIEEKWPSRLGSYINPFLLSINVAGATISMDMIRNIPYTYTVPIPIKLSEEFESLINDFIIIWNLETISHLGDNEFHYEPAAIWCASDVYAQGTYVFIPRYYTWSSLRNNSGGEFDDLKRLIDKVYKKKLTPRRRSFQEKAKECFKYVKKKSANSMVTEKLIKDLVEDWCKAPSNKEIFSITSRSQIDKYKAYVRKEFKSKP